MVHYPLVRALKPALVWPAAFVLALWATSQIPLLFLLACFISPVLLAIIGMKGGLVPMAFCSLCVPAASFLLFQAPLAPWLAALYVLPYMVLHVACFSRNVPFWHAAAAHAALMALAQTAMLLLVRPYLEGGLFSGGADFLVNQVAASPYADQILYQLYQSRLLSVPQEMLTGARALFEAFLSSLTPGRLMPSVRTELLNGLRTLLESSLYSFIPSTVISNAILTGVFGVAFPIVAARRLKVAAPQMDAFSSWHLNRSMGIKVFVLGLGNLLPYLFPNPGMLLAGNMMWATFRTICMIQGAALLDFLQTRGGGRPFMRRLWPCLLYLLMPTLLLILGIADQFLNIRGLRNPKDKEEA